MAMNPSCRQAAAIRYNNFYFRGVSSQAAAAAANEETDHVIDKLNELQVGDSSAAAAAPAAVTESVTDKEHKNKKETESTVSEEGEGTK